MRKGYRECYPLGYRLSTGTALREPQFNDENYMALAISILAGKTPDKALSAMGLLPPKTSTYIPRFQILSEAAAILYSCCGMVRRDVAMVLGTNPETISRSLKFVGIDSSRGKYRRNTDV